MRDTLVHIYEHLYFLVEPDYSHENMLSSLRSSRYLVQSNLKSKSQKLLNYQG